MSLLQGLLGFGAGAAGAFAEQKKADIDAQRQANLARLQAQYKGEVVAQQQEREMDRRRNIIDMAQTNPTRAQEEAVIAGESGVAELLAGPEQEKASAADLVNVRDSAGNEKTVNIQDPDILSRIERGDLVRVSRQTSAERFNITKTELGNTLRTDTQTGKVQIQIGNDWYDYQGPGQELLDPNSKKASFLDGGGFTGEDYLRADVTDKAGGVVDTLAPIIAGTPVIGEIATATIDENLGEEQKLAGRVLQRLSNQILSEEAQKLLGDTESPRLTNLMLGLAERAAKLDMGLFSTPQSIANSVGAAQDVLSDELSKKRSLMQNPEASSDQRVAARSFVTTFEPVSNSFRNILDVHFVRNVTAPTASGTPKNLKDFTKDEVKRAFRAYQNGDVRYNQTQREGLGRLARVYGL